MKNNIYNPMLLTASRSYNAKVFANDVASGIIVAIIALPLSIALALASGVGPEEGLYTAIIAGFLVSLLGGSSVQIAGPTAAFATMVAGIVMKDGMDALAISTVMAGGLLVFFGLFRLGSFIKYIPRSITMGFTAGIAVTIFIGQLKDFFSISYAGGETPVGTMEKAGLFFKYFSSMNITAALLGTVCLVIIIAWPRFAKAFAKIPASFVAVIASVAANEMMHLNVLDIGDLYTISGKIPSLHVPVFSKTLVIGNLKNAVMIAILAAIESLLSAVVADKMSGTEHRSNTELIGQGIANIGSALFGGIPATGAIARTAANIKNGGKTPVAGMVHAVILFLVLVFFMPYASLIPMPAIAAILFSVAYNMSGIPGIAGILSKGSWKEIVELLLSFAFTVFYDLTVGIGVALVFHIVASLFAGRKTGNAA